jgi:phage shock protein PspC (stress-responsive transcriptional regulator)
MKQTVNINLGGHHIIIDDDAYSTLKHYLDKVELQFRNSEGSEEIIHDIEARIAELFQEELKGKEIVTMKEVEKVITIMGTPDDFESTSTAEEEKSSHRDTSRRGSGKRHHSEEYYVGKRLFRDPNDKVVGGVASGLSAYFGIADPVWMRIGFVLLTLFSAGAGIPLYIILWIIVPYAKTASDRLAMRGKPINISSIANSVEEEINDIGDRLHDFSNKMKKKKKHQKWKEEEDETV